MKSLAELTALRDKMKTQIGVRHDEATTTRIVVGMATCGIAAGARPVLTALSAEVAKKAILDVAIAQTGCIGICQYEPIIEVYVPGEEKITYVKMSAEKAVEVIERHIIGKKPIIEYTIGSYMSANK